MSSAGCNADCQSLAPCTDRAVNHFLVQTVPFLLDTLAQPFHVRDPSGGACTHALVGSPTPPSRRGSDPDCSVATERVEWSPASLASVARRSLVLDVPKPRPAARWSTQNICGSLATDISSAAHHDNTVRQSLFRGRRNGGWSSRATTLPQTPWPTSRT